MSYEKGTELAVVGQPVKAAFEKFAEETGRKLRMEIEPGTYLLANSCALLSTVQDIVTTGANGHEFIKLDAGMTEVLRPSLYGALRGDSWCGVVCVRARFVFLRLICW